MIRVLAVHQGGGVGGAPVSLLTLLQHLEPRAFQSHAIFTEAGPIVEFAHEVGVDVSVVPTGGALFYSAHARLSARMLATFLGTFPGAVHRARAALRRWQPDVLHLNSSVLLAWAAAARREGVPVVWMVREVLGPSPRLRAWHAAFIRSRARQVVAISHAVQTSLGGAATVVYNAVDLQECDLRWLGQPTQLRGEVGLPPSVRVVAMVGSVQVPKGHWLMLQALRQLPEDVHLLLVTGGVTEGYARSWRGRVKRALGRAFDNLELLLRDAALLGVRDRIHVTGFRRDVPRVLAAADVVVFPSLEPEGFGRPIIEGMAMRRPVVATDVGPSRELLGADAGRLVSPRADELARAVREVLDAQTLAERMGAAGRARVEERFTLERQVAAMQRVYGEVAGAATRVPGLA